MGCINCIKRCPTQAIRVLEDLEDSKFSDLDFIELNSCSGGCVGGVLQVENPYVAKSKNSENISLSQNLILLKVLRKILFGAKT